MAEGWIWAPEAAEGPLLNGLKPHEKLLYLSDASLTLELELLTDSRVEVEMRFNREVRLSGPDAEYLGESAGEPATERLVWLTASGRRLVYARSVIPAGPAAPWVAEELDRRRAEPLGRVLNANKIPFTKEDLQVGSVRCEAAAADLGLDPSTMLAARRYVLVGMEGRDRRIIKASVMEIFAPALVPALETRTT